MRPIDADALTSEIQKYANEPIKLCDRRWDVRCTAIIADMIGTVKTMPTIGGWISVKDHPPEKDEDVIIYGKYIGSSGSVYPVMLITDIEEFVLSGYVPIAWMPLPEPPKEADNE